jgi:ABC-type multidrug transport system fused ATPase/permease subunit
MAFSSLAPAGPRDIPIDADAAIRDNRITETIGVRGLFRRYKWRMLATYALFNIENLLRLAQPLALGFAIDGLLKSSYVGVLIFVGQHLAHLIVGSFRKMYDTRVFTSIYSQLVTDLVTDQRGSDVDVSRIAARTTMSREYVEFFERYVPLLIRATYSVVGALVMLAVFDWMLVLICLALAVPAWLLNAAYGRRTLDLNAALHDRYEAEVAVIRDGDAETVRNHFDEVGRWRVRLSDAEAGNFAMMELFVLGVLVASLVQFCTTVTPEPGTIFAVFRYVLMFIMGLDTLPRLVEQWSRLKDIGVRLRTRRGKHTT